MSRGQLDDGCCFFLQCERSDVQTVDQKMAQKDAQGVHEVTTHLTYNKLPVTLKYNFALFTKRFIFGSLRLLQTRVAKKLFKYLQREVCHNL